MFHVRRSRIAPGDAGKGGAMGLVRLTNDSGACVVHLYQFGAVCHRELKIDYPAVNLKDYLRNFKFYVRQLSCRRA